MPLIRNSVAAAVRAANDIGITTGRVAARRSYGGSEVAKRYTFNDVPVPTIPYQEWYSKRSARGNILLALGLVSSISCLVHQNMTEMKEVRREDLPIKGDLKS